MNNNKFVFKCISIGIVLFLSCSKTDPDECNIITQIKTYTTKAHPCLSTGIIKIINPLEGRYHYQMDKGIFQTSTVFENIRTGTHILNIVDRHGCQTLKEITVDTIDKGKFFAEAASILRASCSSCHSGVNPHAGIDFTNTCDILKNWERIQARAVLSNPSPMPPDGLISVKERSKIMTWINNAHKYED